MSIADLLVTVKAFPMPRILEGEGVHPVGTNRVGYALYCAPYRSDHHPSMSVYQHNGAWLFKDHATGEYGTNIDILIKMGVCSNWREAMNYIFHRYLSCPDNSMSAAKTPNCSQHNERSRGKVLNVAALDGSPAESYVIARHIPITIASHYLSYIRYTYDGVKEFFGIGWPTISGGWAVRWPINLGNGKGKAFIGRGGPSYFPVNNGTETAVIDVFEGIFDFLSIIVLATDVQQNDAVVLNSVENLNAAMPIIRGYSSVNAFMDNDKAGSVALNALVSSGIHVTDSSSIYAGYKDVNEFIISN